MKGRREGGRGCERKGEMGLSISISQRPLFRDRKTDTRTEELQISPSRTVQVIIVQDVTCDNEINPCTGVYMCAQVRKGRYRNVQMCPCVQACKGV